MTDKTKKSQGEVLSYGELHSLPQKVAVIRQVKD